MANVQYSDDYPPFTIFYEQYNDSPLPLTVTMSTKAEYADDSGYALDLVGSGFKYDVGSGLVIKGNITKFIFRDPDNHPIVTISGDDWDPKMLTPIIREESMDELLSRIMSGKDHIEGGGSTDYLVGFAGNDIMNGMGESDYMKGGAGDDMMNGGFGDDLIDGGKGNDRMTGGPGFQHFIFATGYGHDVIVDFDGIGGVNKQDFIQADFGDVLGIKQHGDNVVIDFGHHDDLTLLHCMKKNITADDFYMGP